MNFKIAIKTAFFETVNADMHFFFLFIVYIMSKAAMSAADEQMLLC